MKVDIENLIGRKVEYIGTECRHTFTKNKGEEDGE